MKLVGSYTSPFVRKLSILLLEKGITFEFINELPYNADNGVAQFNPLGKVPVLVTEEGECWFDSPIQSGDYRHCLCRRISQFPPRCARLVCRPPTLSQTGRKPV